MHIDNTLLNVLKPAGVISLPAYKSHQLACTFGLLPSPLQIQSIVRLVVRRSARMAATLLVAVLRLQGWQEQPRRLVVAVDGGVFLKYHNWRTFLDTYLREAFGELAAADWAAVRMALCRASSACSSSTLAGSKQRHPTPVHVCS
jgi:hexokinase